MVTQIFFQGGNYNNKIVEGDKKKRVSCWGQRLCFRQKCDKELVGQTG